MMQYDFVPGGQGICPVGWHVPTDEEWCIMEQTLDPSVSCNAYDYGWRGVDCGGKLKETGTQHWYNPNTGATNTSLFTALGGGYKGSIFAHMKNIGAWWTSSETGNASMKYIRTLSNTEQRINRDYEYYYFGMSVRCLKD